MSKKDRHKEILLRSSVPSRTGTRFCGAAVTRFVRAHMSMSEPFPPPRGEKVKRVPEFSKLAIAMVFLWKCRKRSGSTTGTGTFEGLASAFRKSLEMRFGGCGARQIFALQNLRSLQCPWGGQTMAAPYIPSPPVRGRESGIDYRGPSGE